MRVLPSGVVTFLFTDIQDSTRLWEQGPVAMRAALERHDEIVRGGIEEAGGHVFSTGGDAFCAAFQRASDAVTAAITIQRSLGAVAWEPGPTVRVRMGLHTGETFERGGDYFGPTVNRAARLMGLAKGGQVVCSAVTADLARVHLDAGVSVRELETVRLKGLSDPERVHGVVADGLDANFGAVGGVGGVVGNLPSAMTRLIGRTGVLDAIASGVLEHRVVTLTGPGGVGKTALGQAAASTLADKFPDGVWWVDLAARHHGDEVPWAIAESLAVHETQASQVLATVAVAVAGRRLLVVIDNAEHLLDATTRAVQSLIRDDNELRVLVTSRERLGLPVEREIAVPALEVESLDSSAPALFVERTARPDLVEGDEAEAVLELCRRLDGLPLAIELAASRCRSLSPRLVLDRLSDGLRLLSNSRAQDPRQATMEAAIRWSFDLLNPVEQVVFSRLSVFPTTFDVAAAEAVCGFDPLDSFDVDEALSSLVDKSLVARERERYRLLESSRMFARDRLHAIGETYATLMALVKWATSVSEAMWRGGRTTDDVIWRDRADLEWPSLTAAFEHTLSLEDCGPCAELYGWLREYTMSIKPESATWGSTALQAFPHADARSRQRLLAGVALEATIFAADFSRATSAAQECLASTGDDRIARGYARFVVATVAMMTDLATGYRGYVELIGDLDLRPEEICCASSLLWAVAIPNQFGLALDASVPRIDPTTVSFQGGTALAYQHASIALFSHAKGDLAAARRSMDAAVELCRALRNPVVGQAIEGSLMRWIGAPSLEYAITRLSESLREGMLMMAYIWLPNIVESLAARERAQLSIVVLGAYEKRMGSSWRSPTIERLRMTLGAEEFEQALAEGAQLEIIDIVRMLTNA